ncbi:hypothetical protein OAS39_13830, partial [Pirellulales bacterium]|nr:hypothetical protein [Pirellulales bacterium]
LHSIELWHRGPNGRLAAIGNRTFSKSEGTLRALDYDPNNERVILIFEGGKEFSQYLLIGSPLDFVRGKGQKTPLTGVDKGVTQAKISRSGKAMYVLCAKGALFRVDLSALEIQTILSLSDRITDMACDSGERRELVLVLNGNNPVMSAFEEGL